MIRTMELSKSAGKVRPEFMKARLVRAFFVSADLPRAGTVTASLCEASLFVSGIREFTTAFKSTLNDARRFVRQSETIDAIYHSDSGVLAQGGAMEILRIFGWPFPYLPQSDTSIPAIDPDLVPRGGVVRASFKDGKPPTGLYLIRRLTTRSKRRLLARYVEGRGAITGEDGIWVNADDFLTCEVQPMPSRSTMWPPVV